jgi:hypothetical protein
MCRGRSRGVVVPAECPADAADVAALRSRVAELEARNAELLRQLRAVRSGRWHGSEKGIRHRLQVLLRLACSPSIPYVAQVSSLISPLHSIVFQDRSKGRLGATRSPSQAWLPRSWQPWLSCWPGLGWPAGDWHDDSRCCSTVVSGSFRINRFRNGSLAASQAHYDF